MWAKIKSWLIALGGLLVAVAGFILGRRSTDGRGMGRAKDTSPDTHERERTIEGDIKDSTGRVREELESASGTAENIGSAVDRINEIIRKVEERQ